MYLLCENVFGKLERIQRKDIFKGVFQGSRKRGENKCEGG